MTPGVNYSPRPVVAPFLASESQGPKDQALIPEPLVDPAPYIESKHVVVIGAGIQGVMLSYKLLNAGHSVTCVDARRPGDGSTSRSAACVRAQWGSPPNVRAMRRSISFYKQLPRIIEQPQVQMIRQNGYLYPCFTEQDLETRRALYQLQKQSGLVEVEFLDGKELRDRFPHINNDVLGGTFCRIDGFCFPSAIIGELLEYCRADPHFQLILHAPVIGVERRGEEALAVVTPIGQIEGDVFINATNAWAPRVARLFHRPEERAYAALPIAPQKRFLHFLNTGRQWTQKAFTALPMTVFPSGAYCRPDGGALMIGMEEDMPHEPDFFHDDQDMIPSGYGHIGEDSHGVRTWAEIARWSEVIGNLPGLYRTTSGYYGVTPDRHHIIDYDRVVRNVIHAAGCSGHGVMSAPFNADAVLHLITVGKDGSRVMECPEGKFDLLPFALDPAKRLGIIDPTHL